MNKIALLRIINPLLFAVVLVQALTGLVMLFNISVPGLPGLPEIHAINGVVLA